MQIQFHRNFEKRFKQLSPILKEKTVAAIKKFLANPFDKSLRNHPLKGKLADKRAISVSGNIRIIFKEYKNYVIVIMLDVGTHNQVYN